MTILIASLSTGKGTWSQVIKIVNNQEWEKVFLVTNQFGIDNFQLKKDNIEFVLINDNMPLTDMINKIKDQIAGRINDLEVAVNLISGTGKEHMAIISAVLKNGLGVRLVGLDEKDNFIEI